MNCKLLPDFVAVQRYYYYIHNGIDTQHVAAMEDSWLDHVLSQLSPSLKVCYNIVLVFCLNFVLDVRKLCFLSKQRCHGISVHNVFYDIFGFSEFNRLCSVYPVCGQSRGYFIASVWDVFRALAFWLLYWLYCFSSGLSVCLSLHIIVWIKKRLP